FTRATMSANPTGWAACSALTWATAVVAANGRFGAPLGTPNSAAAPSAATEARRTRRRADSVRRGAGADLAVNCINGSDWENREGALRAPVARKMEKPALRCPVGRIKLW